MGYETAANELRLKIEELKKSNEQLRDELAVVLNENYVYEAKYAVMVAKNNVAMQSYEQNVNQFNVRIGEIEGNANAHIADLERQLTECRNELALIKGSNTFKLWMMYGRMPKPFHKLMRGMLKVAKKIYRGVKKVVS